MALLVLDASVILKWFKEENYTKYALKIKDDFVEGVHEIAAPDLILYEISNAMRYAGFAPDIIEEALKSLIELGIDIVVLPKEIISLAVKLSYKYNITVYDATYLALAISIGAHFVTADKKLYKKIEKLKWSRFISKFY